MKATQDKDGGHEEQAGGDDLADARAEHAAEEACDEEADERQKDDCVVHCVYFADPCGLSPSSC
jgi:hypothetical protein